MALELRSAGVCNHSHQCTASSGRKASSFLAGYLHKLCSGLPQACGNPIIYQVDSDCERGPLRRYHMSCDRRYDVELFAANEDHAVFWLSSEDDCFKEGPDGSEDSEPSSGSDRALSQGASPQQASQQPASPLHTCPGDARSPHGPRHERPRRQCSRPTIPDLGV